MKVVKRIVVIAIVAAVAVALLWMVLGAGAGIALTPVEALELEKGDLVKSVSVTGTVESEAVEKVYTRLSYPVSEIHVEVGDVVEAGDVLARLNTADLESSIAQQRATVYAQQQADSQSVALAQKQYENAQNALEEQYNSQVAAAEQSVRQAEAMVELASIKVRDARANYNNARDDGTVDDDEVAQMKRLNESAAVDYEAAKIDLEFAKAALDTAKKDARDQLDSYKDAVDTAQIGATSVQSQLLGIAQLEREVAEATITAPAAGTVTAVYAEEGAAAQGLMFVIEDTEKLMITTHVKEYDVADVTVGDRVEIKSDATGDYIFQGQVARIAPTSVKDAAGDSADTTDAEFETRISVLAGEGLRIGTKARLTIVVDEAKGVLSVPYEAVGYGEGGEDVVYIPETDEEGNTTARQVPVTVGLENDFYVEIRSPELKEGDLILEDARNIVPGMPIALAGEAAPVPDEGGEEAADAGETGEQAPEEQPEEAVNTDGE